MASAAAEAVGSRPLAWAARWLKLEGPGCENKRLIGAAGLGGAAGAAAAGSGEAGWRGGDRPGLNQSLLTGEGGWCCTGGVAGLGGVAGRVAAGEAGRCGCCEACLLRGGLGGRPGGGGDAGAASSASSREVKAGFTLEMATVSIDLPGTATRKFTSFREVTR